jgi:hypothetical protein
MAKGVGCNIMAHVSLDSVYLSVGLDITTNNNAPSGSSYRACIYDHRSDQAACQYRLLENSQSLPQSGKFCASKNVHLFAILVSIRLYLSIVSSLLTVHLPKTLHAKTWYRNS